MCVCVGICSTSAVKLAQSQLFIPHKDVGTVSLAIRLSMCSLRS